MASRVLLDHLTAALEDAVRDLAKEGLLDFISLSVIKPMMEQGQWQDMHNADPMDTRFLAEEMLAKAEGADNYEALKGELQQLGPIGGALVAAADATAQWAAVKAILANRAWAIKLTRCAAWKAIVADLGYARDAAPPTAAADGGVISALQAALSSNPATRGPGGARAGKTEASLISQGMLADHRWLARLESTAPNAHATATQLDSLRGQWDTAHATAGFDFDTYYYGTAQTATAAATAGFRCQMMAVSNEVHQLVLQRMPDYTSTTATPNVDFLRTLYELHRESMTAKLNAHRGKNDGGDVYDTYLAGLHIDPANWGTGSLPAAVQSALPDQFTLEASMLGTEPEEQVQYPRMVTDTAMLQANAGHFVSVGQADSVQRFIKRTLDLFTREDPVTFSHAACTELMQLYDTILLPHSNDEMASAILRALTASPLMTTPASISYTGSAAPSLSRRPLSPDKVTRANGRRQRGEAAPVVRLATPRGCNVQQLDLRNRLTPPHAACFRLRHRAHHTHSARQSQQEPPPLQAPVGAACVEISTHERRRPESTTRACLRASSQGQQRQHTACGR